MFKFEPNDTIINDNGSCWIYSGLYWRYYDKFGSYTGVVNITQEILAKYKFVYRNSLKINFGRLNHDES